MKFSINVFALFYPSTGFAFDVLQYGLYQSGEPKTPAATKVAVHKLKKAPGFLRVLGKSHVGAFQGLWCPERF